MTFVTIALDNGNLLKLLTERRVLENEIQMESPPDIDERKEQASEAFLKFRRTLVGLGIFGLEDVASLRTRLAQVNDDIARELHYNKASYKAFKVFVIFETEHAQRRCLAALSRGTLAAAFEWTDGMDDAYLWRGRDGVANVLAVGEAPEPSEIYYEDVHVTFQLRATQQSYTFAIAIALILIGVWVCKQLQLAYGPEAAAIWISLTNILIPMYLRHLVIEVEDHVSINSQQLSLFFKLSFFKW